MSERRFADHEPNARIKGIGLMVAAFAFFALIDASAKYLSAWHDTAQIVWARYTGHFLVALVLWPPFTRAATWRTGNLRLQLARSALLLAGTTLNFIALRYLQLAETSSIMFTIPLWVAVLSVPLLGEHIGARRWSAVVAGFIGVVIIMRPGLGIAHPAVLLSLTVAVITALYQIATRRLANIDSAATTQFYTALVGTICTLPLAPWSWQTPSGGALWAMLGIGIFAALGHYLLIVAHRFAPAPILAPFSYTQILWMVAIGYLLFSDLPDVFTIVGGAVVLGSGLYLLHRERVRRGQSR